MSELKAFRIIQGDTGGFGAPSYKCDTDGNRLEEWCDICEVYLKSEADQVISDLEESHKKEVEQLLMEIVELKGKYKELAKLHDKAIQACCDADKVIAEKDEEIAELKEQYRDMDVAHTVHIAKMNARIEELEARIAELEEERRWRKFPDEKPEEKQWVLVFVENPSKYGTYVELRRWDVGLKFDVEDQELYTKWFPLPSAPKEVK